MGGRGSGSRMNSSASGGGGKSISSVIGRSRPDLVSPTRFNPELSGSEYVRPSNFNTVVQNVSNEGGTIYELNDNLSVSRITPSSRSSKFDLDGEWTNRGDVVDYMERQNKSGHLFFVRF